jgi:predicted cation transporter
LLVGLVTACVMSQLNTSLVWAALSEPLSFTLSVLVFGPTFRLLRDYLDQLFSRLIQTLDPRIVCFCLLIVLGFLAAFITPVASALVFVEAISLLRCDRRVGIAATVFACLAIGFGAGLTPLGMPGIAVVLRSLHAGFWYLALLLGPVIVAGVILAALPTLFLPFASSRRVDAAEEKDSWNLVLLIRPGKVYIFIAGLVALSDGLRPLVDAYIHRLRIGLLFWMNTISAVVNNSTRTDSAFPKYESAARGVSRLANQRRCACHWQHTQYRRREPLGINKPQMGSDWPCHRGAVPAFMFRSFERDGIFPIKRGDTVFLRILGKKNEDSAGSGAHGLFGTFAYSA